MLQFPSPFECVSVLDLFLNGFNIYSVKNESVKSSQYIATVLKQYCFVVVYQCILETICESTLDSQRNYCEDDVRTWGRKLVGSVIDFPQH